LTQFGLIGYPLSHSFSQKYFTEKFQKLGLNYSYSLFSIQDIHSFPLLIKENPAIIGLNVTLPYKQSIISYLDELSPEANQTGAVNTIKKLANGTLKGYNTDIIGFTKAIEQVVSNPVFERAIIIGNGGAAKAVYYALQNIFNCENIIVACRTPQQSHELFIEELSEDMIASADIIVQCTPVGMYPNTDQMLMMPYYALHTGQVAMDLVYNPEETYFVRYAKEQGCTVASGLTMLYTQAEASFEIWTQENR
jgi:shikimate dehydrogenase